MPLPIITTGGDRAVADMLTRAQEGNVRARQADAERRVLMLQDNWRHLVYPYLGQVYKVQAVRDAIRIRVKQTYNVLQQICNRVCVAYATPPVRALLDAPQASQDAFASVMREAKIVTRTKTLERYAFAANVVITVPRVREDTGGQGKRLDYEMILPDRAEVYTDTADPMGDPIACIYQTKHGSDYSAEPMQTVLLDAFGWTYFNAKGQRIDFKPHGAGIFPGTVWRLDEPIDDWWNSHRGDGIVDATIEVAHLAARMDWVRHGQDRFREYIAGEDINKIPTQTAGSEGPAQIPLAPGAFNWTAIDLNTPIDRHLAHIQQYMRQAAESLGVPAILVDFDITSGAEQERAVQQYSALAKLRNGQLDYYRISEHDSAWKTALVLRGMGHPSARLLSPDMVRETFSIKWPELTFVDHPSQRALVAEKWIALGISSTFREYQREHPELTAAEARDAVMAIAQEEGELNEFFIQHNIPRGADARQKTLAQMQGAIGGGASGVARQPQDDSNDDSSQPGRAAADDAG